MDQEERSIAGSLLAKVWVSHMTPHLRSGLAASVILVAALLNGNVLAEELAPPAVTTAAVPAQPAALRHGPLDLRVPHITHLFTSEQLNKILAATFRDLEEVEVEAERDRIPRSTPDVWPGIFAPFWALANPTQAWRIFAPLPPDQTRGMRNASFNAPDAYLLEPAGASPEPDPFHP